MRIFALLLLLLPFTALGAGLCRDHFRAEFLFGPEFTLTNAKIKAEADEKKGPGLNGNPIKAKAWKDLCDYLREKCFVTADCVTSKGHDKHGPTMIIDFKDGFSISVALDLGVIEVNTKPMTPSQARARTARIQEYIFDAGKEFGLRPAKETGGGHIHISRKAFKESSLAFRNFLVDFQNRPELSEGPLGKNLANGATLAALGPEQRQAMTETVAWFDALPNKTGHGTAAIDTLITRLHMRVFTESYIPEWGSPTYYQAFNMTRMKKGEESATLEIRSLRPQENARVFALQTALLERWVNRVGDLRKPIPYLEKSGENFNERRIVNAYAQLLRELDLPWEIFKDLLPARMRELNPVPELADIDYRLGDFK